MQEALGVITWQAQEMHLLRLMVAKLKVQLARSVHRQFGASSERFMDEWKTGKAHPAYSNLMKYIGTELNKKRHELVMAAGGSDALEWESERANGGKKARDWLRTKANSIEGGTSEVMLNVVAKRILEMPGA